MEVQLPFPLCAVRGPGILQPSRALCKGKKGRMRWLCWHPTCFGTWSVEPQAKGTSSSSLSVRMVPSCGHLFRQNSVCVCVTPKTLAKHRSGCTFSRSATIAFHVTFLPSMIRYNLYVSFSVIYFPISNYRCCLFSPHLQATTMCVCVGVWLLWCTPVLRWRKDAVRGKICGQDP